MAASVFAQRGSSEPGSMVFTWSTASVPHSNPLGLISAIENRLPPGAVAQIPFHRLFDAAFKIFRRPPAELSLELGCIDPIAAVMARAVGDKCNQALACAYVRWLQLIQ